MGRKETFVSHCALIHCLQRRQTWIDATPDNMNFQRKPDCNWTRRRRECNKKETNTVQEILKKSKTRICRLGGRVLLWLSGPKIESWIRACCQNKPSTPNWISMKCAHTLSRHETSDARKTSFTLSLSLLQTWICNAPDRVTEVCTHLVYTYEMLIILGLILHKPLSAFLTQQFVGKTIH